MDVLTSETCWTLNNEIIKQVTSSWSFFIQLKSTTFPSPGRLMWGLFFTPQKPYSGSGCLTVEVSRSCTNAPLPGRTPPEEGSACCRDKTQYSDRQTYMRLVGFEPPIPVSEWPQTCVLDGTATEIGHVDFSKYIIRGISTCSVV